MCQAPSPSPVPRESVDLVSGDGQRDGASSSTPAVVASDTDDTAASESDHDEFVGCDAEKQPANLDSDSAASPDVERF